MTDREIYLQAAKRIAAGTEDYSCIAIPTAAHCLYDTCPQREAYQTIMLDGDDSPLGWVHDIEARNLHVLLLCMMAACCEDFKEPTYQGDELMALLP